jgi:hypothetical protein
MTKTIKNGSKEWQYQEVVKDPNPNLAPDPVIVFLKDPDLDKSTGSTTLTSLGDP